MKQLILTAFALISFYSFNQNNLFIGVTKDISSLHTRYKTFRSDTLSLKTGSIGFCVSYVFNPESNVHVEPFIQFSFLPDESDLINFDGKDGYKSESIQMDYQGDVYTDSYSYNRVAARSMFASTGFNLYKRVSKYFSIGGGFHFSIVQSQYTEYIFNDNYVYSNGEYILATRSFTEKQYDLFKFNPTFPIVLSGYLPLKNDQSIRFSLLGHISNQARLSCSLGFCF